MSPSLVSKVVVKYTNGRNAKSLSKKNQEKIRQFWKHLEKKRGAQFVFDVIALSLLTKSDEDQEELLS